MLVAAIIFLAIGYANSQQCKCGGTPALGGKVVGGWQADEGAHPWSCSLESNGRHICGGSILNGNWMITAAHCVGGTAASYKWRCGLSDRTIPGPNSKLFSVRRVIAHPQYNSRLIQNDIALMELTESILPYTNYIQPICFPDNSYAYETKTCWVSGWGSTFSGGSVVRHQQEVDMPMLTDAACKSKFGGTNNMLNPATQCCAGITGANKDTCQGDSGGPLIIEYDGCWYLVGLTSWGYGCGDGGVYTKCAAFKTWVEGYTGVLPSAH